MKNGSLDRLFRKRLYNHEVKAPQNAWAAISRELDSTPPPSPVKWSLPVLNVMILIASGLALGLIGAVFMSDDTGTVKSQLTAANSVYEGSDIESIRSHQNSMASVRENAEPPNRSLHPADYKEAVTEQSASVNTNFNATTAGDDLQHTSTAKGTVNRSETRSDDPFKTPSSPQAALPGISPKVNSTDSPLGSPRRSDLDKEDVPQDVDVALSPASMKSVLLMGGRAVDEQWLSTQHESFMVTDCYNFGKNGRGGFALDVYTGPMIASKSMSSRNEDVSGYIDARDSTETGQLSWNAGLRVGYEHLSGFTIRVGAHYSLVNEKFRQETPTINYEIDPVSGDTLSITPGVRVRQTQNRFHMVDITLLPGYQIKNGDWFFGIQAGPTFNILFNGKGDMLDQNGDIASFSNDDNPDEIDAFKSAVGLGVYGSVYASRRIGSNLYAFAEPHVLHRLSSITQENYPIEQQQTQFGIALGIRLMLGQ